MGQRTGGTSLTFEAHPGGGIATELRRENLHRNAAIESGVTGLVHLPHSTSTDHRDDFVGSEPRASRQRKTGCGFGVPIRRIGIDAVEDGNDLGVSFNQPCEFLAQLNVPPPDAVEESSTVWSRQRDRLIEQRAEVGWVDHKGKKNVSGYTRAFFITL